MSPAPQTTPSSASDGRASERNVFAGAWWGCGVLLFVILVRDGSWAPQYQQTWSQSAHGSGGRRCQRCVNWTV